MTSCTGARSGARRLTIPCADPASLFKKREATVNIGLPVISPPIWTANVGLGTPAQSVAVLLDTGAGTILLCYSLMTLGSANLAVTPPPGNACSGCATNAVDAFDATKSSTWAQVGCGSEYPPH